MLQKINNPKSTSYLNFKEYCKGRHITWNWLEHNCEPKNNHKNATTVRPESWNDESINFGFYAHLFLIPPHPRALYSTPVDERTLEVHDIIRGILEYNNNKLLPTNATLTLSNGVPSSKSLEKLYPNLAVLNLT